MKFDVKITNDFRVGIYLGNAPARVQEALEAKWGTLVEDIVVEIRDVKLNGTVLNRVSGKLAGSVRVDAKVVYGSKLRFVVRAGGPGVPYAAAHEYGVKTAAHDIFPVKKKALAFFNSSGEWTVRSMVHHPGSLIPERSYMRSTMEEFRPRIREAVLSSLSDFLSGKIQ